MQKKSPEERAFVTGQRSDHRRSNLAHNMHNIPHIRMGKHHKTMTCSGLLTDGAGEGMIDVWTRSKNQNKYIKYLAKSPWSQWKSTPTHTAKLCISETVTSRLL